MTNLKWMTKKICFQIRCISTINILWKIRSVLKGLYYKTCSIIWKKIVCTSLLIETFSRKISRLGCLIETVRQPSLNTQSCIRGLLVVRDFCLHKKRVWADYEQLFRVVFSRFGGEIFFLFFLKNILATALKSYIK